MSEAQKVGVTGCCGSCYQGTQKVVGAAGCERDGRRFQQKYVCLMRHPPINMTDSNLEGIHARSEIG